METVLITQRVRRTVPALVLAALMLGIPWQAHSQLWPEMEKGGPTRADTLRGMLTPLRTCYDVRYYILDVRIDPATQTISGRTTIRFTAADDFTRMQVDLFRNMTVDDILLDGSGRATFNREEDAVFVTLPEMVRRGTTREITVAYHGAPRVAKRAPWDGGFIWTKDSSGGAWVAVACQGTGASLWWPNKDHQSDKPDSMLLRITVPPDLMDVSNGRLRSVTPLADGWNRYEWFVSSPINNYCVTVNVGRFAHFSDLYAGADTLSLDYYVLPENLERARRQFGQVKQILAAFEFWFGPYPFPRDGYKLIESPHLGMEHQSAIAYGNGYRNGYTGSSASEIGLAFDFIIVHESAHEWWGNSVTSKDIADMWIHESFGAYAEALYVERLFGKEEGLNYVNARRSRVANDRPILGPPNVNREGSGDMYDKGQLILNTFRHCIDNDSVWLTVLRGVQQRYRHASVTTEELIAYFNRVTGSDWTPFFDQYLRSRNLPKLELSFTRKGKQTTLRYRWKADVSAFAMPVCYSTPQGRGAWLHPGSSWKTLDLGDVSPDEFRIAEREFYCEVSSLVTFVIPGGRRPAGRKE